MISMRAPALILLLAGLATASAQTGPVSLAGRWRMQLDRDDAGVATRWFERSLVERVQLPGSLPEQGIGDEVTPGTTWTGGIVDPSWFTAPEYEKYRQPGKVKVPFWLQPDKVYTGVAWYQRDIDVPAAWEGLALELLLERPHWETRVWVDAQPCGTRNSLGTPHRFGLPALAPGKHVLTIRVDNRMVVEIGENSHSISDHTQGNWNGIAGRIELRALPMLRIASLRILPANEGLVRLQAEVENRCGGPAPGALEIVVRHPGSAAEAGRGRSAFTLAPGEGQVELAVKLDQAPQCWSEFQPALYQLEARLLGEEGQEADRVVETFGFRELKAEGTRFLLNGQSLFLRGTLDCCIFPRTGHPPVEAAEWKRIIGVAKSHGLNLIRFHSWCPPEAAFAAADELGFYFHVEASSWANQSSTLGDGKPVDQWIYEETESILRVYGNHPSFLLMAYGNEPSGKNHKAWLSRYVDHFKATDPRRCWTSGAGWPELPENQWHCTPKPRIQGWGEGLKSRINSRPPETRTDYRDFISARPVPVVSHEIGQWCVYPDLEEIPKYTGYLKPKNFEIFRDRLQEHHLLEQARDFLLASGKLQALCYKEEIESALRTPGMAGFELLDLHDFPGQGTALVGVLDPFWEEKGYISAEEFRRFCGATVLLARLDQRVFTTAETLKADLEVAHFGPAPLGNAVVNWSLGSDGGIVVAQGAMPARAIPVGNGISLGSLSVDLRAAPAPSRCRLSVQLAGTDTGNHWDLWVYPDVLETAVPPGIRLSHELDRSTLEALNEGEKVLLCIPPGRVRNSDKDPVALGFSSVFWNTAWTRRQPPTTLGILCDPRHPALADFPTDFHSNWQWWYLITRSGAMILDELPGDARPVVQVIDDWFTARKLGLLVEARVGKGKLLVCSMDLEKDLAGNPVARQMRHSLLRYLASERFQPAASVTAETIAGLISPAP